MSIRETHELLGQLRHESYPPRRRLLAYHLRRAVAEARTPDAETVQEVQAVLAGFGWRWEPTAAAPRVGEAWVLLYGPVRSEAALVRVTRGGPAGCVATSRPLGPTAQAQIRTTHDALCDILTCRGVGVPNGLAQGHVVHVDTTHDRWIEIDGPSLGAAVAVATVSGYLKRPPRADTVTSAEVDSRSTLRPVGHMTEKLEALARQRPGVHRLIVADGQELGDTRRPAGIEILRRGTLADALRESGLVIEGAARDLPLPTEEALRRELRSFEEAVETGYQAEAWLRRSAQARFVASCFPADSPERTQALGFAALFALHGGDERAARDHHGLVDSNSVGRMSPAARVWYLVSRASSAIDAGVVDERPEEAIDPAKKAVDEAERALTSDQERSDVLGRAYGTLGRALVHAGQAGEGLPWLEKGLAVHRDLRPGQVPRSLTYLAMGLRIAGQPARAVQIADEGLAAIARTPRSGDAAASESFLLLERGRASLEAGDAQRAVADLHECEERQERDDDYPKLGALRSLVRAEATLGRWDEANRALHRCLTIARPDPTGMDGRVAAYAAGEALQLGDDPWRWSISRDELVREWVASFGGTGSPEEIAAVLRRAVY